MPSYKDHPRSEKMKFLKNALMVLLKFYQFFAISYWKWKNLRSPIEEAVHYMEFIGLKKYKTYIKCSEKFISLKFRNSNL